MDPDTEQVKRYVHPAGLIGQPISSMAEIPLSPPPGGAALYVPGKTYQPSRVTVVALTGGDFQQALDIARRRQSAGEQEADDGSATDASAATGQVEDAIIRPAPGQFVRVKSTPRR